MNLRNFCAYCFVLLLLLSISQRVIATNDQCTSPALVDSTTTLNAAITCFNGMGSADQFVIQLTDNIFLDNNSPIIMQINNSSGAHIVIDGQNQYAISGDNAGYATLRIEETAATIIDLTLQNGSQGIRNSGGEIRISNSTINGFRANFQLECGSGIGILGGIMTIDNSIIRNNIVSNGGASHGGGICAWQGSSLTIRNSQILNNDCGSKFGAGGGGLSIQTSNVTILNSTFKNNNALNDGGAIHVIATSGPTPRVSIADSLFETNSARSGGAMMLGNAIVTISNTRIVSNQAALQGGGMIAFNPTINNVEFVGNTSGTIGGGISVAGSSTVINDSKFIANQSPMGGGIYSIGTLSNVSSSTFTANIAEMGGAIWNDTDAALQISNATFSSNIATVAGSAAYNTGTLEMAFSTIYDDPSSLISQFENVGNAEINSSILAGNSAIPACLNQGMLSVSHTLISDGSCGIVAGVDGNLTGAAGLEPALAGNGGLTETFALVAGSQAIDSADSSTCPALDQRWHARPHGAGCDMGAFEYGAVPAYQLHMPVAFRN